MSGIHGDLGRETAVLYQIEKRRHHFDNFSSASTPGFRLTFKSNEINRDHFSMGTAVLIIRGVVLMVGSAVMGEVAAVGEAEGLVLAAGILTAAAGGLAGR